jgi:Rrf2 family protein
VKFSTRLRYGIRTMLEIGLNYEKGGILQKDISANQEISTRTLDHLLHALKTADLITNATGKNIGYTLTRPPSQITMFDIQKALEPVICVVDCVSIHFSCDRGDFCSAKGFWRELNDQIINYFKGVTLQDMVTDQRKHLRAKKIGTFSGE